MNIKDLVESANNMSEEELKEALKNIRQNRRIRQDPVERKAKKQSENIGRLEAVRELENLGVNLEDI